MMPLRLNSNNSRHPAVGGAPRRRLPLVDENGVTVYSQVPPPADIEKKLMEARRHRFRKKSLGRGKPGLERCATGRMSPKSRRSRIRKSRRNSRSRRKTETAQRLIKELRNPDIKFIKNVTEQLNASRPKSVRSNSVKS